MSTPVYYGLNELDKKLESFVDFDGGVFFEAGGNNGVDQSNTCYFERSRNWTGVLVEPAPHNFKACRAARPRSQVVWSALVPPNWPDPFVELTYCNLMTVTNSELSVHGDSHVENGKKFLPAGVSPHPIHAPANTISSILEDCGVYKIDLFSLDIEGFEVAALRGLDLRRFDVKFFCIEAREPEKIADILGSSYQMIDRLTHHDYLYKKIY